MVDTVECLARVDRRQRCDVTDIDLPSRPFDNVKNGIVGGVGWAVGVLGRGKEVVGDEIGCKLGAHNFFDDFESAGRIELGRQLPGLVGSPDLWIVVTIATSQESEKVRVEMEELIS